MDSNMAKDAVNLLLSLPDYEVICPAGGYKQLGESYLWNEAGRPDLIPYANMEQIGWNYEDSHLGIFITNLDKLPDTDWSMRLKLASPAVPEGVWLCLPDSTVKMRDVCIARSGPALAYEYDQSQQKYIV